jgi:short-subunit dehydrogenase involved in D-alanine esterification of teichoic acids
LLFAGALAERLHGLGNKGVISDRCRALLDVLVAASPAMRVVELDVTESAATDRGLSN